MKTLTEVSATQHTVIETECTRYFTVVTEKQTYNDGKYAGKSYRITSHYVSNQQGTRGQLIKTSSQPWK